MLDLQWYRIIESGGGARERGCRTADCDKIERLVLIVLYTTFREPLLDHALNLFCRLQWKLHASVPSLCLPLRKLETASSSRGLRVSALYHVCTISKYSGMERRESL